MLTILPLLFATAFVWALPVAPDSPAASQYTDIQPGVVRDSVTGLEWQKDVATAAVPWTDARRYCSSLALVGTRDWRLPTIWELLSIVDLGAMNPAVQADAFPATPPENFWSDTVCAGGATFRWIVMFDGGNVAYLFANSSALVRCVRGGVAQ